MVGETGTSDLENMINAVNSTFDPRRVFIVLDGTQDEFIKSRSEFLSKLTMKDNKSTAYVCENFTCDLPIVCVQELGKVLNKRD